MILRCILNFSDISNYPDIFIDNIFDELLSESIEIKIQKIVFYIHFKSNLFIYISIPEIIGIFNILNKLVYISFPERGRRL